MEAIESIESKDSCKKTYIFGEYLDKNRICSTKVIIVEGDFK